MHRFELKPPAQIIAVLIGKHSAVYSEPLNCVIGVNTFPGFAIKYADDYQCCIINENGDLLRANVFPSHICVSQGDTLNVTWTLTMNRSFQ